MSTEAAIRYSLDGDGVGWITFDDPGSRANVFNPAAQAALDVALREASSTWPLAIVVISAKERIFIAGADLKWLSALSDAAAATGFARAGQRLFQRITEVPVPVVCAIHGACAGGGLELALACHWRIASHAAVTQIGLPETSLGTIPGWGGCVRLPRLIGVKPALDHILKAQLLSANNALATGLVNELVPVATLRERAKAAALKLIEDPVPSRPPPAAPMPEFFSDLRESVRARTRGHEPAPLAAIDVVEQTASLPVREALEIEARLFGQVTAGDVCKNKVQVFFLRDAGKKRTLDGWFFAAAKNLSAPKQTDIANRLATAITRGQGTAIRRVGVVGAGVMGSGIAQWLAARGLDVVIRDVQPEFVERARTVIGALFEEAVKRGKMAAVNATDGMERISFTNGWDGFETCDLVIEAIVEDVAAKQELFGEMAAVVKNDALLASNTSALPIEEIAGHVPNPGRTLGIHFFNPVSRMPLVELVLGRETSAAAAQRALSLVKAVGKSPVICRSSPGFLVTRVLFFYLNEAVRLWEEGAATAAIDTAMRDFGWPMGPLRLIDEVGVDITVSIFSEMEHYFPGRFTRTTACSQILFAGLKGRKNDTSAGFYRYAGKESLNDPETRRIAGRRGELALEPAEIEERLMRVMADDRGPARDGDLVHRQGARPDDE
ncbi:MAG: 3-hydroxyacyl-CoA dehydrogenase NAD-binding domain-containing protein [Opitutaceae bacterium]|nr:3-hydroxyacyl-CoA dehydrogenase NAD-binding domain-containing protein [Opitutaceae bacterium]